MVTLRLSGLDVGESTLRLLQRHMPQLERLDLAHCKDVTDSSIALLAAAGTNTRNNLSELTLAGLTPPDTWVTIQCIDSFYYIQIRKYQTQLWHFQKFLPPETQAQRKNRV